jgi:hypothetical protein
MTAAKASTSTAEKSGPNANSAWGEDFWILNGFCLIHFLCSILPNADISVENVFSLVPGCFVNAASPLPAIPLPRKHQADLMVATSRVQPSLRTNALHGACSAPTAAE